MRTEEMARLRSGRVVVTGEGVLGTQDILDRVEKKVTKEVSKKHLVSWTVAWWSMEEPEMGP
jgi:hypothetical protein